MSPPRLPRRVPGLDGLRACACLWVVLVHFAQNTRGEPFWNPALLGFALRGELGVPIFFVLSGFLLALPFVTGDRVPGQWRGYAVDRLARIFPGYLWCLLVMAALGIARNGPAALPEEAARLAAAAACLSPLHPATIYPTPRDPALWSVAVECWFYAAFAAAAAFVFRDGRTRQRNFLVAFLASLVAAATAPAALALLQAAMDPWVSPGLRWGAPRFAVARAWLDDHNPVSLFPHFLIGVSLCLAVTRRRDDLAPGRRRFFFDVGAVAAAAALVAIDWQAAVERLVGGDAPAYAFPVVPLLAAGLIFCLIFSAAAGQLLDNAPLRAVARYSFGIYLWHMPVMLALAGSGTPQAAAPAAARFGLILLVAFSLGAASYHLIEVPGQRWVRRRFGTARRPSPACPAEARPTAANATLAAMSTPIATGA